MAKKNSISYQADLLRKKGQRRIERLQAVIGNENTPQHTRNWAREQVKELRSAIQGTRQYSKTGKRYKSKSTGYISGQISRLENAVKAVAPRYAVEGSSYEITVNELNMASVGLPSSYTKDEAKTFYRATQKYWQQEGIGNHDRNMAIVERINRERIENGLSPLTFEEIVDKVVNAHKDIIKDYVPEELTEEQKEAYSKGDNADEQLYQYIGVMIKEALDEILNTDFNE